MAPLEDVSTEAFILTEIKSQRAAQLLPPSRAKAVLALLGYFSKNSGNPISEPPANFGLLSRVTENSASQSDALNAFGTSQRSLADTLSALIGNGCNAPHVRAITRALGYIEEGRYAILRLVSSCAFLAVR